MICWAFWELLEANASLSPRVCPVGSGAQSYSVQRISQKQSRSSKITSKALWTSNSVSKGGWVSCYLQPGLPNSSQGCLLTTVGCFFQVLIQNLQGPRAKWKCGVSSSKLLRISRRWLHSIKPRAGPVIARGPVRPYESHTGETSSGYFLYWFLPRKVLPGLVASITLHLRFPCHPQGPNLSLLVLLFVNLTSLHAHTCKFKPTLLISRTLLPALKMSDSPT